MPPINGLQLSFAPQPRVPAYEPSPPAAKRGSLMIGEPSRRHFSERPDAGKKHISLGDPNRQQLELGWDKNTKVFPKTPRKTKPLTEEAKYYHQSSAFISGNFDRSASAPRSQRGVAGLQTWVDLDNVRRLKHMVHEEDQFGDRAGLESHKVNVPQELNNGSKYEKDIVLRGDRNKLMRTWQSDAVLYHQADPVDDWTGTGKRHHFVEFKSGLLGPELPTTESLDVAEQWTPRKEEHAAGHVNHGPRERVRKQTDVPKGNSTCYFGPLAAMAMVKEGKPVGKRVFPECYGHEAGHGHTGGHSVDAPVAKHRSDMIGRGGSHSRTLNDRKMTLTKQRVNNWQKEAHFSLAGPQSAYLESREFHRSKSVPMGARLGMLG